VFDDEAGSRATAHFDFTAERTLLGASLAAAMPVFEAAKSSSSSSAAGGGGGGAAVVLQLCFVISGAFFFSGLG